MSEIMVIDHFGAIVELEVGKIAIIPKSGNLEIF